MSTESKYNMASARLTVPGMGSDHCAGIVKTSLKRLNGIGEITTNIAAHRVEASYDSSALDLADLRKAVEKAGYDVASASSSGAGNNVQLIVPGMGSDHCAGIVRESLLRLDGIQHIDISIASHKVHIEVSGGGPTAEQLKQAVEKAGYDVAKVSSEGDDDNAENDADIEGAYLSQALKRLWIAGIPTTLIMLLMIPHMFWQPIPGYMLIVALLGFPVVFLYGGAATHKSTWRSLTNRTFNMDVLISRPDAK